MVFSVYMRRRYKHGLVPKKIHIRVTSPASAKKDDIHPGKFGISAEIPY